MLLFMDLSWGYLVRFSFIALMPWAQGQTGRRLCKEPYALVVKHAKLLASAVVISAGGVIRQILCTETVTARGDACPPKGLHVVIASRVTNPPLTRAGAD
jgi:hypothetical protein